jgi:hypothetical protein
LKHNTLLFILHLLFNSLFAQVDSTSTCGTDALYNFLMETNEEYRLQLFENNENIKNYILNNAHDRSNQTYVIPVVVHVIHLGEAVGTGNNISDAQILEAIQGLNNRFSNSNGMSVDFNMEFCLAVRDPNNQPTNGINRVDGSAINGYASNGINFSSNICGANETAVKNLSRWPVNQYYNIWVVNKICGNYAGYAYYPWGGPNDGTVMARSYMTSGSITLAHELAHGFHIYHTFQGDGTNANCPANTSCIDLGDRVCDTPPHKQNDCGGSNPCGTEGVWDDSRRNYMSYCGTRNRFTEGQMQRARAAAVVSPRLNLLNSLGCVPVTMFDAGVTEIVNPIRQLYKTHCDSSFETPKVSIRNFGTEALNQLNIYYKLNNLSEQTFQWSGNLSNNQSTQVVLPSLPYQTGINSLTIRVGEPNGNPDQFSGNNELSIEFNYLETEKSNLENINSNDVSCFGAQDGNATYSFQTEFTITEDFETDFSDWTFVNGAQTNKWIVGTATANGGQHSVYISDNGQDHQYNISQSSIVHFYKDFYFPEWASNITVKIDWKCMGETNNDFFRLAFAETSFIPSAGNMGNLVSLGLNQYLGQANFNTQTVSNIQNIAGERKRLVVSWRNNSLNGTQPPAAIDNITVSYRFNGANTYQWSNGSTNQNIQNLSAGIFEVEATNLIGCNASQTFEISEPDSVIMQIEALGKTTICEGDSVLLSSSGTGDFLWNTGKSTQQIIATQTGDYFISVEVGNCTYQSNIIQINVIPNPEIPLITEEGNILLTDSADFYQWYFNNELIEGATNQTFEAALQGIYSVKVKNEYGCENFSEPYRYLGLSASQLAKDKHLLLFPNPSDGSFYLKTDDKSNIGLVKIYNALGAKVYEKEYVDASIHLSHLAKGVYTLEAWVDQKPVYRRLIFR